jgi:orotidine-5'-phosphate decarboxylase
MAIAEIDAPAGTMADQLPNQAIPLRDRLIVALDVESADKARQIVDALGDTVTFYKIGLGLQFRGGIQLATDLKKYGKKVFLDSKIWDVGATTKAAVQSIAELGMDFVTVHGNKATLIEAVAGRGNHPLKLFAITVLTSLDDSDLHQMGYTVGVEKMVMYQTRSAIEAGFDGVITSGLEAAMIRQEAGPRLIIVTPGIRSEGIGKDDQKRVVTPEGAIKAGADHIVMGRQILGAKNRHDEAKRVLDAIDGALT